ncbi:MAG: sugar ABC transporter substrate-binding protein [Candidatus Hydrogenedentes bacterium]|nr:sugar ABC transporter substrate-binding protein [Candidatus Hydrogenedentota bacterium]
MLRRGGKIIAWLLIAALWVVSGCSVSDAGDRMVLRFNFWGTFRDLEFWKTVVADFEAANPDIKIRLEYITGDYGFKLPLLMVSNTAADIILMDDELYPAYAARGYLEDLAPYIERDRSGLGLDEFLPTSLQSFTYRGLVAALPWDGFAVLIFYNKDLFDREGIPYPSNDWTWQEYREIAKRLTKDLDGDGRVDQYGSLINFGWLDVEPIVWSYGADILNEDRTRFAMNSPRALEALNFIYDIKYKDHSVAWIGEMEGMLGDVQLLTGRVGMTPAGLFLMMTLVTHEHEGMRWGVAHMPVGPYGDRHTRVSWDGIAINKSTPYKEEAWRFIKYVLSEPAQKLVGEMGRALPVRRDFALKYFVKPDTEAEEERALEATEYGKLTPITPKYMELREAMNMEFDMLNIGKITPKEALDRMEPKVDEVLRKELAKWGRHE